MFTFTGFVQLALVKKIYDLSKSTAGVRHKWSWAALAMGNTGGHTGSMRIPPGNGPHQVGCTDLMVGHTTEGTFLRLFYPCNTHEDSERPEWIPSQEYFNGLADFMKINRSISERIFNYLFGLCTQPYVASWPPKGSLLRLWSIGNESASATFYFTENAEAEQQKEQASCKPPSVNPPHLNQQWMYHRPIKPGESEFPLRNKQVKQRADECIRALDLLIEINSGSPVENVLRTQFDFSTLENCMDLCKIAIMGHSFGGATVIEGLCKEGKFKCGVALDAWMFPIDEEIFPRVKQPIFFINSEKFQWVGNILRIKKLDSAFIPRKMITIRGTVHQSFPDFTFLTGNWLGKLLKLKGDINPNVAMDLCNKASLAFLQRHLSLERDFNQWDPLIDGKDDNLIQGTNITVPQSSI
ncbi:platelet-activating factor acetylhydrolase isoform X1 [Alosa alosa]|uniref:platelet-activating factor acetylhydrolase isoform X1 n=2 Tax=Alosa alosa TaxID=278164 RepID=UPI0020154D5B|nr:platelet-activating factor acetylhydrolase isoform X1 [Alosa alosa]